MPTFLGAYGFDDYPENNLDKPVKISLLKISHLTPVSQLNLGATLPLNSIVLQVIVKIVTKFEGLSMPDMTIGSNTIPTKYLSSLDLDFEMEGIFKKDIYEPIIANEQPKIYWNPLGSSAGQLLVFLIFSDP